MSGIQIPQGAFFSLLLQHNRIFLEYKRMRILGQKSFMGSEFVNIHLMVVELGHHIFKTKPDLFLLKGEMKIVPIIDICIFMVL